MYISAFCTMLATMYYDIQNYKDITKNYCVTCLFHMWFSCKNYVPVEMHSYIFQFVDLWNANHE